MSSGNAGKSTGFGSSTIRTARHIRRRAGTHSAVRRAASETLENRVLLSVSGLNAGAAQTLLAEGPVEVDIRASDLTNGTATTWNNTGAMGGSFAAVGTPTVAQSSDVGGIAYKAVQFNGTNQAFTTGTTPAPADLTGSSARSIEVWVLNPTIDNAEETMVAWAQRGGPDGTNESFSYGNTYGVGQWGGGFDTTWAGQAAPGAPGTAPAANFWHYMVFTYDGNVNNVYVDGQLWTTHTIGALGTNATNPISIAAQNTATTPASASFGKLDIASVRISSGALTTSDISNNYAQGVPGQSSPVDHAPVAPTNVQAAAVVQGGATYSTRLTFKDNADNETQYRVLRSNSSSGPFTQVATIAAVPGTGSTATYFDPGVVPGQTYYYEVASYNAFNGGTTSPSTPPTSIQIPTATQTLVAEGPVEVDLRASDLSAGPVTTWNNDGTAGGNFALPTAITTGPNSGASTDAGGVSFQSVQFGGAQSLVSGFNAPADLTAAAPRSMEVWALNPTIDGVEETMVAWGQRGGPDGTNEGFSYGNTYGVGQWGAEFDSTWAGQAAPGAPGTAPAANVWHYMVYTYDGNVNNVYVDGQLVMTHTIGALATNPADPISIAAQNQANNPGSAIFGSLSIASVRLSGGALTPADISHNYAQGVPGQSVPVDHAPAAPTNVTATPGPSSIQVSFTDNADNEIQYRVLRATSPGGPFTQIGTLPAATGTGSTLTFTDTKAQSGVTYYYEVGAFNTFNGGTTTTSAPVSALIPAPVAGTDYYPFEEGTGTTTADTIGGNNGTLVGAAPPTWIPGQSGQPGDFALNFTGANAPEMQSVNTGTNGLVQLQNSLTPVLGGTSTLTAWVKTTQVSATANHWSSPAITGNEVPGADFDISWGFLDQTGHIGIAEGDSAPDIAKSSSAVNDGQWHFVAFTRNALTGTVQVFVDGSLQGQSTGTDAQATQIKTGYFGVLGAQTDVNDASGSPTSVAGYVFYNGGLDDVHIFNRVISTTEVQALYAGPQTHAPAAPSNFTATPNAGNVTLTWKDNSDNEVGFIIDRATSPDGPWTQVTATGRVNGSSGTGTYVDKNLAPGTYYYRIRSFNGFNGGVESVNVASGPVIVPAQPTNGVELHIYNQAYWAGPVAYTSVLPNVDFVASNTSPAPGFVHGNENSMVFSGKVRADTTGIYTFVSNTSEDGYLYVDGVLVSEDPGVHGQRDAGNIDPVSGVPLGQVFPISLTGGQSYDFVLLESNQSSVPAAHMEWITPSNTTGTPTIIPQANLTPTSDTPAAPTNLAPSASAPDAVTASHAVDLTFNTANNAVVYYQLQRSTDNGTTWLNVGQRDPAGGTQSFDGSITPSMPTVEDAMPQPGATYLYRVLAVNYDHTSSPSNSVSVTIPPNPAPGTPGVEAHYFRGSLLGSGNPQVIGTPPAEFALLTGVDANYDTFTPADTPDGQNFPDIPRIGHVDWSTMFTGKIHTDQAGTYTFITNTDDDGYLWVNDVLVSSDPGGHGQRNATNLTPISPAGNTDYDFIMVHSQGIFGAGAHLYWIEPGQTTPALVGAFSPISDLPTAPTALTAATGSPNQGTGVTLTWADTSPSETGFTVERATDAGFTQNVSVVGTAGFDTTSFTDTTAQPGTTYFYRLRAFNWDGTSANSNVASAAGSATGTFAGTAGNDTWYVREDADHLHVDIYNNNNATGTPIQVPIAGTPGLSFQGLAGNDSLTIDYSNGDPGFANGISFDGGTGTDTLRVIGANAADTSGLTASALARGANATAVSFTNTENENLQVGTYNVTGSQTLGNLTLGGGAKLIVAHGATPGSATLDLQSLNIASGGTLDLKNNNLLVHYAAGSSPAATIRQLLVRGYNGGAWNGTGIITSDAATHPGNSLGFADSADGVVTGQAANTVLVKYTRVGDLNLDGTVAFADLLALAQHYNLANATWDRGDVNYDGSVNFADLLALAQNYNQSASTAAPASAAASAAPALTSLDQLVLKSKKRRKL